MLLCSERFELDHGDRLDQITPGLGRVTLGDAASPPAVDQITAAFLSNDMWPDQAPAFFEVVGSASNLKWVHIMFAGVDHPMFRRLASRGVRITTSAGASAPGIAETVLLYLSALSRELPDHLRRQRDGEWEYRRWRPLAGRSVAVVGYGPVGQHIVALTQAVGLSPTIVRRQVQGDEPCPTRTLAELSEVAADHDVLILALPLNQDTEGLITSDIIDAMGPESIFINVARGKLVDEAALTDALVEGRIAGAGLDVFVEEPLDPSSPLWTVPNVIITPHHAGASTDAPNRVTDMFFENLGRWSTDQPLRNEATFEPDPET
ncbi:MAG: D-2-hydroxyacid dehydrogenase [Actinomycetota bacterium]